MVVSAVVITDVGVKFAAELIASFFGDNIDNTAHGVTVLGVKRAADHLQFLHHIFVHIHHCAAVVGVGYRNTVDPVRHFAGPSAAHVAVHVAGLQGQHLAHFGNRQSGNFLVAHHGCGSGQIVLDRLASGDHRNRFGGFQRGFRKGNVDRGRQVNIHLHTADFLGVVTHVHGLNGVNAGRDVHNQKITVRVGSGTHGGPLDDDVRSDQRLAGIGIGYPAGYFTGGPRCQKRIKSHYQNCNKNLFEHYLLHNRQEHFTPVRVKGFLQSFSRCRTYGTAGLFAFATG